jgi:hypothetical protein
VLAVSRSWFYPWAGTEADRQTRVQADDDPHPRLTSATATEVVAAGADREGANLTRVLEATVQDP